MWRKKCTTLSLFLPVGEYGSLGVSSLRSLFHRLLSDLLSRVDGVPADVDGVAAAELDVLDEDIPDIEVGYSLIFFIGFGSEREL